MVNADVRFLGDGRWQPMTLPVSVQAAQTLSRVAKELKLGDEVQITEYLQFTFSGRAYAQN